MRAKRDTIELLSPAKNAQIGKAAIAFGADAVYIGAPKFGARSAAGNELADIADLVVYAHRFSAKVYVTLNTLIYDSELAEVEKLIWSLYELGVDALIIQDMGILEMNLPPIALHASTQCDIRDAAKVKFLEQSGFEQVVLARELSVNQVKGIVDECTVKLECFVHGALCVSYSGQCYLSEATCKRSANRGACAQMCRLPYTLSDASGRIICDQKYLLSMKDFNATDYLAELIDAGVASFKIEGRLKEMEYVKNITAYYRQKLDLLLSERGLRRSSSGVTTFDFIPNPQKTFSRGQTSYFLSERSAPMSTYSSSKALGEYVGRVGRVWHGGFDFVGEEPLENGDGLCALDESGSMEGFRVNRVEQNQVFLQKKVHLELGMKLYRNQDMAFDRLLSGAVSHRVIPVELDVYDDEEGVRFVMIDADGVKAELIAPVEKNAAKQVERMCTTFKEQLSKLGDTCYTMQSVRLHLETVWFVPIAQLNAWRRALVELLDAKRLALYRRSEWEHVKTSHVFPFAEIGYQGNVSNHLSKQFYERHGACVTAMAFELSPTDDAELMRTRYCIKYELGLCPKQHPSQHYAMPLQLSSGSNRFELSFDCGKCEMVIKMSPVSDES